MKGKDENFGYSGLIKLSFPLSLQMIAISTMPIVDACFVIRLGNDFVAAVACAKSFLTPILMLFVALLNTVKIVTSRINAEGAEKEVSNVIFNATLIACAAGITISIIGFIVTPLLSTLTPNEKASQIFINYFKIHILSTGFALIYVAIREGRMGFFDIKVATTLSIIANIANAVLNYIFISFPFSFISPINGVALSTVLAYGVMGLGMVFIQFKNQNIRDLRVNIAQIRTIINLGYKQALKRLLESSLSPLIIIIIGRIGAVELSVYYLLMQALTYAFYPVNAIAESICVFTGKNAKNMTSRKIFKELCRKGIMLSIGYTVLSSALIFILSIFTSFWFSQSQFDTRIICIPLIIACGSQFANCFYANLWGALRGLKKMTTGVITSFAELIIIPSLLSLFDLTMGLNLSNIFLSMFISKAVIVAVCVYALLGNNVHFKHVFANRNLTKEG